MSRVYSIILTVGAFILALDQWTKHVAVDHLSQEGDTIPFLSWFSFTLVHNYGAAFGLFRDIPTSVRTAFFALLPIVVLALLWFSYVRKFNRSETLGPLAMGLVLGGAIGNLVDRIRFGYVVDFIDWFYPSTGRCLPQFHHFTPDTCHWPVFNVADSAISIAMVLLLIYAYRHQRNAAAPTPAPTAAPTVAPTRARK